jgi:hypothetical protein
MPATFDELTMKLRGIGEITMKLDPESLAALKDFTQALTHAVEKLSSPRAEALELPQNQKITVYLDGRRLATAVAEGAKKNGRL